MKVTGLCDKKVVISQKQYKTDKKHGYYTSVTEVNGAISDDTLITHKTYIVHHFKYTFLT